MLWAGDVIIFIYKNLVWDFFDTGGLFLVKTVISRYRGICIGIVESVKVQSRSKWGSIIFIFLTPVFLWVGPVLLLRSVGTPRLLVYRAFNVPQIDIRL